MKLKEQKVVNPLDNLEALSTRINSLKSVCPFDLEAFYAENKGLVKKYLRKNTLDLEIAKNQPKFECPHCHKTMTKSNLTRWHGDNCKYRVA